MDRKTDNRVSKKEKERVKKVIKDKKILERDK